VSNRKRSSSRTRSRPSRKGPTPKRAPAAREPEKPLRPSRTRLYVLGGLLVAVVGVMLYFQYHKTPSPTTGPVYLTAVTLPDPSELPGLRTNDPPWDNGIPGLRARLEALDFASLLNGSISLHIHQHLDVYVHGTKVTVPADIGIDPKGQFLSPLHTHDTSGIVHVESPTQRQFVLGQFFDVWGVRFTGTCLGGHCDDGADRLRVFVDGHEATGDVQRLALFAHEEIVVTFGTQAQLPDPIPKSYGFPPLT